MANGNLTLKEFWSLPESERGERYKDLSDHDKFGVRQGMYCPPIRAQCNDCRHFKPRTASCAAFPERVPSNIFLNKHDHHKPYPGDNGILFEPKD